MKERYITLALCNFFQKQADGEYFPFTVRQALGMSQTAWRHYAKSWLYPAGSYARRSLASVGVTVATSGATTQVQGGVMVMSKFVKQTGSNATQSPASA